ncbi:hypothetical protein PROFUN_08410 [Planoprotostelium fungivorum]|uniref:Coatomer subunit gamma n=1 Tax=Planoprotostelium fungivorum TaxID=1890364 RepID=A0A2P6NJT6_9EUKA|nr:hypothetical protein PROFUN_08410 [Planoprotostelium fungivorum]
MDKRDRGEKKDDDESYVPFQGLEKGALLQERRILNETPLNPKKCCQFATKLLYLVEQGEKFTKTEATEVFFAITKLFQSKDIPLRRMVYLVLKALIPMSDDVIIVIASLTKDINSKNDLYKANAIRVLTQITDSAMLAQIERYLKQAIVDKEGYVASAALVSGAHLLDGNTEIVKRWISEVQDALSSKHVMVQYHALGLFYELKKHDRLAVNKLVTFMIKNTVRSPFAHCLLIRFTAQLIEENPNTDKSFLSYIETCLRHKSDMVIYEAAKAICGLTNPPVSSLTAAITVLQLFLSSPKPSLRFAAVRTLNKLAQTKPAAVTPSNLDIENLITDSNRSIATLAITTLLKTGQEASVDRLMKQISGFINEISDEFKIVVVDAIRVLCTKFPQKQRSLLTFLASILREEGGFEYKKAIVDTIMVIISEIPESKESGLTHLCEFIEDCEFTQLAVQILHLLGKEGPPTQAPSKYIRHIYNRISLENAAVRAAAVSALVRFGVSLPSLRPSITSLIKRATTGLVILNKSNGNKYLGGDFNVPLANLEFALRQYQTNPSTTPFSISMVPAGAPPSSKKKETKPTKGQKEAAAPTPAAVDGGSFGEGFAKTLSAIPQFAKLGTLQKSSKPFELTESETEYVVSCIKHCFATHFVLQFNVTNTLNDQVLEKVTPKVDVSGLKGTTVESVVPLPSLPYGAPGACYALVKRPTDSFPSGTVRISLKFITKEFDVSTGQIDDGPGYEDDYTLEDLTVDTSDYVQGTFVANFKEKWEEIGDEFEVVETYSLSTMKSLQGAVDEVTKFLGMQAADRTETVPPKKNKHVLLLSGNFITSANIVPALVRVRMMFAEGQGAQMELAVRSTDDEVSTAIAGAI